MKLIIKPFFCLLIFLAQYHFCCIIIQAIFPKECGHAILVKQKIFKKIEKNINQTINSNNSYYCKDKNITYIFGKDASKEKNFLKSSDKIPKKYIDEYNILLSRKGIKNELIGTSLVNSSHYFDCLFDGEDCDLLSRAIINKICTKVNKEEDDEPDTEDNSR